MVKSLPAMQETQVQSLGWEDPLEKKMATHSSTLAWEIPWTEKPIGYSLWGCKESDTTERPALHFTLLDFILLQFHPRVFKASLGERMRIAAEGLTFFVFLNRRK